MRLRIIRACLSRIFLVERFPNLSGLNLCIKLSMFALSPAGVCLNGSTIHQCRTRSTHSQGFRLQARNDSRRCRRRGSTLVPCRPLPRIGLTKASKDSIPLGPPGYRPPMIQTVRPPFPSGVVAAGSTRSHAKIQRRSVARGGSDCFPIQE